MRIRWAFALVLMLLAACSPSGSTLSIDVLTDLVPGPEFDLVDVSLFPAGASRTQGSELLRTAIRPAAFRDAAGFRRGLRAADLGGVADGAYTVRVRLLRPPHGTGTVLVEKWSSIVVRGSTRATVGLDAACVAVMCPAPGGSAAFTECARGRCVDPFCDPDDRATWAEHCCDPMDPRADCAASEVLFCATASECDATTSPCSGVSCERGYCLFEPREGACAAGEFCAREEGCEALPAQPSDAGMPDAGTGDAGIELPDASSDACRFELCDDAADPCFLHFIDCASGACVRLSRREVGASCDASGGVCSSDARCLACPAAPLCDPMSDVDGDGIVDRLDVETCDGADNDGDGEVDEGLLSMNYLDRDSDTYGDDSTLLARCAVGGTATRGGDCNDRRFDIAPNAPERCNGIDDDCDMLIDGADLAADLCIANATCGGGACACNAGYRGDGLMCTERVVSSLTAFIKASNPGDYDYFGTVVALSADGSTMAVGAPGESSSGTGVGSVPNEAATGSGAVYVYRWDGARWEFEAFIKASETRTRDRFGAAVALSADGSTLAVGAPADGYSGGVPRSGTAYLYRRTAGTWSFEALVRARNERVNDYFGHSVALSRDGNTLAVGALYDNSATTGVNSVPDTASSNAGAVHVFVRTGATWSSEAYIKATNTGAQDTFGRSVALSADGNTLVVGANGEGSSGLGVGAIMNDAAGQSGAVYVYVRVAGEWTFQEFIKAINTNEIDSFGYSVALSADGNTLAVGARDEDSSGSGVGSTPDRVGSSSGAVYVYERAGAVWTFRTFIKASNTGVGDSFGLAVALSPDGTVLAVGAPNEDSNAVGLNGIALNEDLRDAGAVYLYARRASGWQFEEYVKPGHSQRQMLFGASVSLTNDNALSVGGAGEYSSSTGVGAIPGGFSDGSGAVFFYR